ncbi:unnamed protein product [Caenorhabditis angaria]|uniref:Uncharacterized protein n=1 Tax=Caenorhabditis angaria TaxID=860376 RepID=A0A9P1I7B0_9PELO|nr:unnamed protein product [Caenorhabditis angaria]
MAAKTVPKQDVIYYFLLQISSAFMLSAAHNVLFFVLDIKLFVTQFLHYFFTFLFLSLLKYSNFIPTVQVSRNDLIYSAAFKLLETCLSAYANSHNRTGELFLVRIFDFLTTISVFAWTLRSKPMRPEPYLVLPLGLTVSISWFEPGQLEYTRVSMFCAFLLPFSRAASLISLRKSFDKMGKGHLTAFTLEYCRIVSVLLFIPAIFSYFMSTVEVTASWESIDYVLMSLSFLFMICNLYSEIWLQLSLNFGSFLVFDNSKYLLASCAQWIIQNMANPNILAFGGKIVAFACIFRIWAKS